MTKSSRQAVMVKPLLVIAGLIAASLAVLAQPAQASTTQPTTQLVGVHGMCLDLPFGDTTDGTDLWVWGCQTDQAQMAAQTWVIGHNGEFRVKGKCLDVEGPSRADGADAQIWTCEDVPQQKFNFTVAGEIRSQYSGKCLTVDDDPPSYRTRLSFRTCDARSSQRWAHPGKASSAKFACNGTYVNDVLYDSTSKGLVIRYWPTNRARLEANSGWSELASCKPPTFENWSFHPTQAVVQVHSQAACHAFWGITPLQGGFKWDLESYSNLPWDTYGDWWDTECQGYRLR